MHRRYILVAFALALTLVEPVSAANAAEAARTELAESRILDWVRAAWPVFVLLSSGIVGGIVLALGTRFASRASLSEVEKRLDQHREFITDHNHRIRALEGKTEEPPSRAALQEHIGEISERLARVESAATAIDGRLETQNTYLHTIIEQAIRRTA